MKTQRVMRTKKEPKPTNKEKLTIRLTPEQLSILTQLKDSLKTTYSLLVRSIILDFLTRNEETLDRIIINGLNIKTNEN